jgi:hypothetical protein
MTAMASTRKAPPCKTAKFHLNGNPSLLAFPSASALRTILVANKMRLPCVNDTERIRGHWKAGRSNLKWLCKVIRSTFNSGRLLLGRRKGGPFFARTTRLG